MVMNGPVNVGVTGVDSGVLALGVWTMTVPIDPPSAGSNVTVVATVPSYGAETVV
jgi:hypothetical protein